MSLKQTQTVELPPVFEEDFFRIKSESDEWINGILAATRQYDLGNMALYRSLARSALNFDTVAADLLGDHQVPISIKEEQDTLQASVPTFVLSKVQKFDRQLNYFSRCATYAYPRIANEIGSIDILMNNQTPWYRQLIPVGDDPADRLLMTRILSECFESFPDNPEQQAPYRLELYEKRAKDGIKPFEIDEFRNIVSKAVAISLDD